VTIRFILLDIEGTTTDIDFVHKVLFPYSAERLAKFVSDNANDCAVQEALDQVKITILEESQKTISDAEAVEMLLHWIQTDRKHGALKTLQGMIWKTGFEQGDYQGHVYPDVPAALERWQRQGIGLGIYSSGSVQAQKLLFGHSVFGDLTPYLSHYFDTQVGGKKEVQSYKNIAEALGISASEILFLSDVPAELDAAQAAGFQTTQLLRTSNMQTGAHPTATGFANLAPTAANVI
jgi:enolase-phosphatase E1